MHGEPVGHSRPVQGDPVIPPYLYQPGDVLLYARQGIYNRLIQIKTWSRVSHVEIVSFPSVNGYAPLVVASRNGIGVGQYQFDRAGLYCVLRPIAPFDHWAAMDWFWEHANGQGYDWLGLLAFFSAKLQGRENGRMFCSELATRFLRAGGVDPFNGYDADGISPGEFLKSPAFRRIDEEAVVESR
jgi:hypothetical protein